MQIIPLIRDISEDSAALTDTITKNSNQEINDLLSNLTKNVTKLKQILKIEDKTQ